MEKGSFISSLDLTEIESTERKDASLLSVFGMRETNDARHMTDRKDIANDSLFCTKIVLPSLVSHTNI